MTQILNPRRFYIDRADDQPVVRTVPVRVPQAPSPATHQVQTATEQAPRNVSHMRLTPRRVSKMVRSARNRSRHARS